MSEVRWVDNAVQQAEERRQTEKSDEEKRQSQEAFEKRLAQDRVVKQHVHKGQQAQQRGQAASQAKAQTAAQQQGRAQQARGREAQQGQVRGDARQNAVLAHVRSQGGAMARGAERPSTLAGEQSSAVQRDMERIASQSQEGGRLSTRNREDALTVNRGMERDRLKEMDDKDRARDADASEVKGETRQQAAQQTTGQQAFQQRVEQQARVEADERRGQQGSGSQGGSQSGGGQPEVRETEAARAPSSEAMRRAHKAAEIQKLCEKLLDHFYMGAAPDGSAMMRMELKEGVLQGLVIELKVDDKRKVKLTLSGGNKEAIDFVVSSRGELSRALSKKGLELESVAAV